MVRCNVGCAPGPIVTRTIVIGIVWELVKHRLRHSGIGAMQKDKTAAELQEQVTALKDRITTLETEIKLLKALIRRKLGE